VNPSIEITAVTQAGAVLVALIAFAGVLVGSGAWVSGRRARRAADAARQAAEAAVHELLPNSGTSSRDALDRLEEAVAGIWKDVGGIREEIRHDRRIAADRLSKAEDRIHDLEHPPKEKA
jgi:hypothetical protein